MARRKRSSKQTGREESSATRYEVVLDPRSVGRMLLLTTLVLLGVHFAMSIYNYQVEKLHWVAYQLFHVDAENNLPSWFSSFQLLFAAVCLGLLARRKKADGDRWSRSWAILAFGFLLLSIDEIAGVHESINTVLPIPWSVPALLISACIGVSFVPFLLSLPRAVAVAFAGSGAAYVAAAAGVEMFGNSMVERGLRDTLAYAFESGAEEAVEMLSIVFFVYTLLRYMQGAASQPPVASLELGDR